MNKKTHVVKSVIRLNIIYPDCYENYNMKYSFLPSDKMTQSTNIDDNSSNSDIRQPDKLTDTQNQDESNNNVDVDFSEFDLTDNTEDNDGFTPINKLVTNYGVTIQTVSIYIKKHPELFEGHLKKAARRTSVDRIGVQLLDDFYITAKSKRVVSLKKYKELEDMVRETDDLIEDKAALEKVNSELSAKNAELIEAEHQSMKNINNLNHKVAYLEKSTSEMNQRLKSSEEDNTELESKRATLEEEKKKLQEEIELDKDRKQKNCEYAVLVSLLESDNELFNAGIVDVSYKYEKMYVVRPQCFIPIITLLRNAAMNAMEYKQELAVVRNQNIDISNFEENLMNFKNDFSRNYEIAHSHFDKAVDEIDKTIQHLEKVKKELLGSDNQLRIANNKVDEVSIKKLTKGNITMQEKFENLKKDR